MKFTEHLQDNKDSMLKILNNRLHALTKVGKSASFKSRKMIANGVIILFLGGLVAINTF